MHLQEKNINPKLLRINGLMIGGKKIQKNRGTFLTHGRSTLETATTKQVSGESPQPFNHIKI